MKGMQRFVPRAAFLLAVLCLVVLVGCATKSTYVRPDTITKTVEFSDTDLRMNAEAMVNSLVSAPFLQNLVETPTISIKGIQNRTSEQIDTKSLEKTIETALLKSGMFQFVDRSLLGEAAQEKALVEMQRVDVEDAVKLDKVKRADYFLRGELTSIDNRQGSTAVRYKKLTMELVDTRSTAVVWMDEKEIKKVRRTGL